MKLMLKTQRIITAGGDPLNVMIPATEPDAEIFEKFRANTWYKSDCRKARNPEFHKKGMALVRLIFESQEQYRELEDLLVELKLKAGWYTEHVRQAPPSKLLHAFRSFAKQCPGLIRERMLKFHKALREQESVVYLPKSISFAEMDELDFQQFYNAVIDIAVQDYGLKDAVEFIGARKYEPPQKSLAEGSADG